MFDKVIDKYRRLTEYLIEEEISISTMESCTGGLIASLITDTDGASGVMKGSFVTYSNDAKVFCGVPAWIIKKYGVYSEETAVQMAKACQSSYGADIGIGITGTFSNVDPNNADSVSGIVYMAISYRDNNYSFRQEIPQLADRRAYKLTVADALYDKLMEII